MRDYKYCFLSSSYSGALEGKEIEVYELVFSDNEYNEIAYAHLNKEHLLQYYSSGIFNDKIVDFAITSNDVLLADTSIRPLPLSELSGAVSSQLKVLHSKIKHSFYDFIITGIENDFMFVHDSIVKDNEYMGTMFTPFNDLRIEYNKMHASFFLETIETNSIIERPVIELSQGEIVFQPFYYAVPLGNIKYLDDKYNNYIKEIKLNNIPYILMKSSNLQVVMDKASLAIPLLNRAVNNIVRCDNNIRAIKLFISNSIDTNSKDAFVHKTFGEREKNRIIISAGLPKLSKKSLESYLNAARRNLIPKISEENSIGKVLAEEGIDVEPTYSVMRQIIELCQRELDDNFIMQALYLRDSYMAEKLISALHVLKVVCYANFYNVPITSDNSILYGSDLDDLSTIKEISDYEFN